ncbi:MAG TPA: nickel-binding protein [Dehalococcoidia bacterium]|nr:nickel-binding protein [Dehalococcoidia bacterium]
MALYRIERDLGDVSAEEIDAAAFRAVACAPLFTGLTWRRSYYDAAARHMTCYYEAASTGDLRKHAEMARIPCDSVNEVTEYLPERYR